MKENKEQFRYTIKNLKDKNLIIFESIMGSRAYGTSLPTSDIDLRGVFMQPLDDILKHGYVEQVSDDTNDTTYYELRRYLALAQKNNPEVIELLFAPHDCVQIETPEWLMIKEHAMKFVSKICRLSFTGYAIGQIKKAKGYNKKINWEKKEMVRKNVLDFCYILTNGGSKLLNDWLVEYNKDKIGEYTQKDFGLVNIDHAHDTYALYNLFDHNPIGIVKNPENGNDVQLSSIPKGLDHIAYLTFNKDAYSSHCKRYGEYQTWLKERNEDRFKMNKEHGKNYDSKNMMHTFRLLKVGLEIAKIGEIRVRRPDEEIVTLMKIRRGEYEFDDLVREAEEMIEELDKAYEESTLPNKVDNSFVLDLLYAVRIKQQTLD